MLKKSQRLSLKQFENVLEKGRVSHSSLFLLRVITGTDGQRISAVAPVKIAKKAVIRNKIRRKIYAALRPLLNDINSDIHAVVFAKKNIISSTNEAITADLKDLFSKSKLLSV